MSATVPMNAAKRRLAVVWFGGAGLLCLLVALQSVRGVYTGETEKAWAWLLPSIMPTLSLIIGVLVFPAPAFSNQANLLNQPAVCTLACNPARQTCSRYPANQVPFRATRPNSVPMMYKIVPSGTRCDSSVCVQDPTMCFIGTF